MDKLINKLCYTLAGSKAAAGVVSRRPTARLLLASLAAGNNSDISLKDRSLHGRSVLYHQIELLKLCTRVVSLRVFTLNYRRSPRQLGYSKKLAI